MSDGVEKMVLNTVYLPPDLDDKLRVKAFREGRPKGDIIRDAVESHLASMATFAEEARRGPSATSGRPSRRWRNPEARSET